MEVLATQVGPIMTNCYLLADKENKVCAVVDPGGNPERVEEMIQQTGCELKYIFLTHGHYDHVLGVSGLLETYPDVPVYIHPNEVVDGPVGRWSLKMARLSEHNQCYYHEGDVLTLGDLEIRVMETPGHSSGSVCLVVNEVIFCGDTLFYTNCGRTDFPDGSYEEILKSLGRLYHLEGDYKCCPGHEQMTTLAFERQYNPYMRRGAGV